MWVSRRHKFATDRLIIHQIVRVTANSSDFSEEILKWLEEASNKEPYYWSFERKDSTHKRPVMTRRYDITMNLCYWVMCYMQNVDK